MTTCWRYYDTSIFTFRRYGLEILGFPVTLGQDILKFRISKNSVFQDQDFFSKNRPKIIKKTTGLRPAPPPHEVAPLAPTKAGTKCLSAEVYLAYLYICVYINIERECCLLVNQIET